jgi:hypothetical protein
VDSSRRFPAPATAFELRSRRRTGIMRPSDAMAARRAAGAASGARTGRRGRMHLLTASRSEIPKAVEAFRSAIDLIRPMPCARRPGSRLCAQAELRFVPPADAYCERGAAPRAGHGRLVC